MLLLSELSKDIESNRNILIFTAIFFLLGVLNFFWPKASIMSSHSGMFKNEEPTEVSIFMARVVGFLMMALSIASFIMFIIGGEK